MHVVYSPRYVIDIGAHVFPTAKYRLVAERIRAAAVGADFVEPAPASWADLRLVHGAEYLHKMQTGQLSAEELAALEVPWSPAIVEGFRLMTGGTLEAAQVAVRERPPAVFHVGGGFHHAFAGHGEGFCLFNDVAVAIRRLLASDLIDRAAVIDLDVHQGNGTAFLFEGEPRVFTCSLHQQHNYPAHKPRGSLDIGLADGVDDERYLAHLGPALTRTLDHHPDVVFYLAGADPYADDVLGGLALSKAGLRARDRLVLGACAACGVPVVVVLAGGYARRLEDTVAIHVATFEEAAAVTPASDRPPSSDRRSRRRPPAGARRPA